MSFKKILRTMGMLYIILFASTMYAQVMGVIYLNDGGSKQGGLRYLPASKVYEVRIGSAIIKVPENKVVRVSVKEPRDIKKARYLIKNGQYDKAKTILWQVRKNYYKLGGWDKVATGMLVECLVGLHQNQAAIKLAEDIIASGDGSIPPNLVDLLIDTYIKAGKLTKAKNAINRISETGSRDSAAIAAVKRGDLLVAEGKPVDALVDGYLRTVFLFKDQKKSREVALYKAYETFKSLGRQADAETMKSFLLSDYPKSKYTSKLR